MLWRQLLSSAALLGLAAAQVTSDCNPYKGEKCDPNPAFGTQHQWYFNSTPDGQLWEETARGVEYDNENGARFTINGKGDSPTIRTKFYIFFGRVEFHLKAATGAGVVSSMMLLSDDLDEIDWEFIGNDPRASTNYYGKGSNDYTNGEYHDTDVDVQDKFHNYTTVWAKEQIDFYIDGRNVRTTKAVDAVSNGTDWYPQTPMRLSLGIWAGGDPSLNEWTRKWAGGDIDYNAGPYNMYIKDCYVEDFSTGKEYVWTDDSGDWESIKIVEGNSTAYAVLNKEPEKSLNEKFNDLPQGAKVGIYAGGSAVAAVLLAALVFYCIKQRRRGAAEARLALQNAESERMEMNRFKNAGVDPDSFTEHGAEYSARDMKDGMVVSSNSYTTLNASTATLENEKPWVGGAAGGGAGTAAGFGGAAVATRAPDFHDVSRSQSPLMRSQSPMVRSPGSPGPQQAYGASRMQQSPRPGPISPTGRSFSDHQGYGPSSPRSFNGSPGYGPQPHRNFSDNHGYGMDRSYSPGPQGPYGGYRQ